MKKNRTVVLIESQSGDVIFGTLVFEDHKEAFGEAILRLDEVMPEGRYHFSGLYELEAEAGYGIDAINEENPELSYRALILHVEKEEGE